MAAIVRPQPGGGGSLKAALIAFVALTVLSLAGTVIILTNYSDMQQRMESAQGQANQTRGQLQSAQQQIRTLARAVIDEETDDVARIRQVIAESVNRVVDDPALADARLTDESAVVRVLQGLYATFQAQQDAMGEIAQDRDQLRVELERSLDADVRVREAFADATEDVRTELGQIEQQYRSNHEAWQDQVAELASAMEQVRESASEQLARERQDRERIAEERDEAQQRVQSLSTTLAGFRPSPDVTAPLQMADGYIVRTVTGENIAYINLGRRDGIRRGMTFSVYSRVEGIPPDGRGKATIEVVEPFDVTSECRVTSTTPGQPILQNDLIANPAFDPQRKLNFLVAGDFDLNFDGQIDDPTGQRVRSLIEASNGAIVERIDARTDFVVLGAPPEQIEITPEIDTPEIRVQAERQQERLRAYERIEETARAMSVPILTRTQFLHFMGVVVPRHVTNDRPLRR